MSSSWASSNAGIIYGEDIAYTLVPPDGWVLDNKSGVSQGIHAVFYPEGKGWEASEVVLYSRMATLNHMKQNIEGIVQNTVDQLNGMVSKK